MLNLLIFALEVCFKRYPTRKSISSISTNVSCTSFDDAKLKTFNSLFKLFLEDLFNSYKTIETAWERFNEGLFWEVGILKVLFARSNSLLVNPLSSLPNIIAKLFIFLKDKVQSNRSSEDTKNESLFTSIHEINVLRGIVHQINWFLNNSKKNK